MPSWNKKTERQYERIKEGYARRGMPSGRAKEIAGRTVNKERRESGKTPNRRTQGTGHPRHSLEARTKDELENIARQRNIRGRSAMRKQELVRAIRRSEG